MKSRCTSPCLLALALALGAGPALAQTQSKPDELSLGDAVTRVQQETKGQVLSAESRRWDRRTEYRVKVLTPEGHVRVMTVPATGNGSRPAAPAIRNIPHPPARDFGGKERH